MGLVEKLLTSLNLPTQPEIDRLWAEEATPMPKLNRE
ncbi:MAG TPA: hypothetical protein VLK23_02285 [Thermodesulfobacteriota bacterium]|nr:hypothetical protein [Thermodesulfobacteriota bacterium]